MTEPELSRRERKKDETRERLLSAAWTLYRDKGFEATTVEEITNAADVAKGTFFNYFSSKEEMLVPLAAWRMAPLWERIDIAQNAPASALGRIALLLNSLVEGLFPDHDLAHRTFSLLNRQPELESPPLRLKRVLIDLVREAQQHGELRDDVDPRFLAGLLMAASFRGPRHEPQEEPSPQPDIDTTLEIMMEGLAGPQWRNK